MKGFKIQLNDKIFNVYFQDWNNRSVKCTMVMERPSDKTRVEFTGRSLCNVKAGDEFNLEEGQKLALNRALKKYINVVRKMERDMSEYCAKMVQESVDITGKFDRIWEKHYKK